MQFHQTLYQWQSDTTSYVLTLYLIETFEYFPLLVDRNTNTGVTNLQYQPIVFLFQRNSNALPAFCIFESIWKQVINDQFQIIRIEKFLFLFQFGVESISNLLVACQFIVEQEIILYQLMRILFLYFQLENSQFGTAIIHQLVDKMQQTIGVALDIFQLVTSPAIANLIDYFL